MQIMLPGPVQKLSLRGMVSWRTARLRRIGPRPFGLAGDRDGQPLTLGDESSSAGLITEIRAALTRTAVPLDSLSLVYGDYLDADLARPLVEVTTHWDGRGWFAPARPPDVPPAIWEQIPPPAWELGDAERRDEAITRQQWNEPFFPTRIPAEGPFAESTAEILVSGSRRTVPVVGYKHYTALWFAEGDANVTVLSRHPLPQTPRFEVITNLEDFYAGYSRSLEELARRIDGQHR